MKGILLDLYEVKGKNLLEWYIGCFLFVWKFCNGMELFGIEFFMLGI